MTAIDAIAEALDARTIPGDDATVLVFEHDSRWHKMSVREAPELELKMAAPDLRQLELHVEMGRDTVLGADTRVDDPRWRVRTSSSRRAARLFDEAPWPGRLSVGARRVGRGVKRVGVGALVLIGGIAGLFTGLDLGILDGHDDDTPGPHYIITVEGGVAMFRRHGDDGDHAVAIGMARRLVQLVTRPARCEAEIAHPRQRYHGENGPYR